MRLYPAIDIKGGQCVRLRQGEFKQADIYSNTPFKVAQEWELAKASYIHVVDLDGALAGEFINRSAILEIVNAVSIPVQTGGGIRSIRDIEDRLNLGIKRVIIGTKAIQHPEFVRDAIKEFGAEHIVVGIDAKDGFAAIEGWEKVSENSAVEVAKQMKEYGVKTIVYTDIAKDGMLKGPNISYTNKMALETGMDIIASGGVSSIEDLVKLSELPIEGAIVGKALYENRINLKEAVKMFE